MAGAALTTASTLRCPHGGTVTAIPGSARVSATATAVRSTDTFVIAGCPFVAAAAPSPCVRVSWIVTDNSVTVDGAPTLSAGSVGLCLNATSAPQGPVVVASTQARLTTR